jgi:hypothetical protein
VLTSATRHWVASEATASIFLWTTHRNCKISGNGLGIRPGEGKLPKSFGYRPIRSRPAPGGTARIRGGSYPAKEVLVSSRNVLVAMNSEPVAVCAAQTSADLAQSLGTFTDVVDSALGYPVDTGTPASWQP